MELKRLFFIFLIFSTISCVHYSGQGDRIITDIKKTIRIFPVYNHTPHPDLGDILYQKTKKKFILDGRLNLVKKRADIQLKTVIKRLFTQDLAFDQQGRVITKRLQITLNVECLSGQGAIIWREKDWELGQNYTLNPDQETNDQDLQEKLCAEVAAILVSKTIEGW